MPRHGVLCHKASFNCQKSTNSEFCPKINGGFPKLFLLKKDLKLEISRATLSYTKYSGRDFTKCSRVFGDSESRSVATEDIEEASDEDDELCPVECVKEFRTDEEFLKILEKSKEKKSLVVVDFYRTACGSCKYIEQIFSKLCKGSGDQEAQVIFLKHNVIDEYDEPTEVAERLRIRVVPLFHFYKDGELLEAFPTRDKERIVAAISKYTSSIPQDHQ